MYDWFVCGLYTGAPTKPGSVLIFAINQLNSDQASPIHILSLEANNITLLAWNYFMVEENSEHQEEEADNHLKMQYVRVLMEKLSENLGSECVCTFLLQGLTYCHLYLSFISVGLFSISLCLFPVVWRQKLKVT